MRFIAYVSIFAASLFFTYKDSLPEEILPAQSRDFDVQQVPTKELEGRPSSIPKKKITIAQHKELTTATPPSIVLTIPTLPYTPATTTAAITVPPEVKELLPYPGYGGGSPRTDQLSETKSFTILNSAAPIPCVQE